MTQANYLMVANAFLHVLGPGSYPKLEVTSENFGDLLIEGLKEAVAIKEGRPVATPPKMHTHDEVLDALRLVLRQAGVPKEWLP